MVAFMYFRTTSFVIILFASLSIKVKDAYIQFLYYELFWYFDVFLNVSINKVNCTVIISF